MGCGASAARQSPGEQPTVTVVSHKEPTPEPAQQLAPSAIITVAEPSNLKGGFSKAQPPAAVQVYDDGVVSLTDMATPQQALAALLEGNRRFVNGSSSHPHQDFARIQQLCAGQHPSAAVLGCADSRVPVEIALDQGFGDVFVCRVAGNIATPEEVASLEYAVLELQVKVVLVLGHTQCGAVKAAMSGKAFPGFIDTLVDHLDVAIARVNSMTAAVHQEARAGQQSALDRVVRENVKYQVQRCKRSAILADAIAKGRLLLVGGVYELDTGRVQLLDTGC